MVLLLALLGEVLSIRYCVRHKWKKRSPLYIMSAIATGYVALVYSLSIGGVVSMADISGQLFRLGFALLLAVLIAGAWIDQ